MPTLQYQPAHAIATRFAAALLSAPQAVTALAIYWIAGFSDITLPLKAWVNTLVKYLINTPITLAMLSHPGKSPILGTGIEHVQIVALHEDARFHLPVAYFTQQLLPDIILGLEEIVQAKTTCRFTNVTQSGTTGHLLFQCFSYDRSLREIAQMDLIVTTVYMAFVHELLHRRVPGPEALHHIEQTILFLREVATDADGLTLVRCHGPLKLHRAHACATRTHRSLCQLYQIFVENAHSVQSLYDALRQYRRELCNKAFRVFTHAMRR